ncbi:MAG: hypothetical protein R2726_03910 [Acidimicrobiales bacterium]
MAPDRPTDHGRLDDAALADRIRATATAVAERTAAPARDLDDPTTTVLSDRHRSSTHLIGVAAAALLVVALVAGVVVALRDRDGGLTTGEPRNEAEGDAPLPRLLPAWVPDGYSPTESKVTPGPPPRASFLHRYERTTPEACNDPAVLCPYGPGGPSRVEVRAAPRDDPQGLANPVTNPTAAQQVDVNGDAGWVNVTMDGISASADDRGYTVTWDHGAVRVSVTSRGASSEDTVRIARGVTVGGTPTSPTADIAADGLAGTLQPTYAGPDLSLALGALPGQVGMARLVYTTGKQTPYVQGTPPGRVEGVAPDQIFLTEYDAPIGAASPWWLPLIGRSQPTSVDGITCVTTAGRGGPLPPASGPLPWTSVLCADDTTFAALGSSSIPRADLERMARSLRPTTASSRPNTPSPSASVDPGQTTGPGPTAQTASTRSVPAEITDPSLREALAKPRIQVGDGRGEHGWMDTADLVPQVPASVPPGWSPPPAMHPVYASETGDEVVGYMVDGVGFVDRARAEASDLDPARLQRELAGPGSPTTGP